MTRMLPDIDRSDTITRYTERYRNFGYSPRSLGWDKGKQDVRFEVLTSLYDFRDKCVLDVGCGFGDLNRTLSEVCSHAYSYVGVDLVPALIEEAQQRFRAPNVRFLSGDFLEMEFEEEFDFVLASGIFNHKLRGIDNYDFIDAAITKAMSISRDGVAFDFLSDKVEYRLEHTFHSSPEKVLALGYEHSRNIVLRNDYMPFEFSLFIFRDDSFSKDEALFNRGRGRFR